uniref:Uncharacterized protein n=2 Tax=Amphimedon queenslandica TaxID=400682 RepID=A0A1X7TGJ0_AMPQE
MMADDNLEERPEAPDSESDIEEEEDSPRSEHGDTTDAENEIIYYWERLRRGDTSSLTEPPYTNKPKYLPVSCLGLLPRSIRIRLLCLLPAVDVAKLEGTPVTIGISMDEIWEYIFNERLPLHDKKKVERECIGDIDTVEELMKKGMESVSWKNAYFNAVFFFSQVTTEYEDNDCECVYRHFVPDLYYDPSQCSLKQLELEFEFNDDNSYKIDEVNSSSHDALSTVQQPHNPFPLTNVPMFQSSFHGIQKSLPILLNESISHLIIEILQHHQELRKLSFFIQYKNAVLQESQLTQCISDLLLRPDFKDLTFETRRIALPVSFNILLRLFHNFFYSPNPVTLSLCLKCPDFPPLTDLLIVNHEQESNKSLELTNCTLSPHFSSLLPCNLVLNSLKVVCFELDVLSSFANLESIKVKSFSLEHGHFFNKTSSAISSLFRIVSAQEWNIIMTISDDVIDLFTSLISEKAYLLRNFGLMNWNISTPSLLSMIQSIFSSLSPADVPHFKLTFNYRLLDDQIVKAFYDLWEKHCNAVKLKKINVLDRREFGKLSYMSVLLEMANEVYAESWR